MQRRLILIFGVLIGLMWMGEVVFGNLGDTVILGNVRTFHFHAYRVIGWSFISGALALTVIAGLVGAYRIGGIRAGLSVGVWSGLMSGAITLVTILVVTVLFRDSLLMAPSNIAEFAGSAPRMYSDALGAGVNHLWIGPLLGLTLGWVGAVVGNRLRTG
jgi:hypothetical protein